MSLLSIVQAVCRRVGVPVPATVYGTVDAQVLQLMALLEEEGTDLAQRGDWEALTNEATLTTTAAEDQGAMTSLATNGFRSIKQDTLWDRTDRLPIPLIGSTNWQRMKAIQATGPRYHYRLRGGHLLITPTIAASHTLAFEYLSKNWILGADGTTYKQYFTLDTDTVLLPEELVLLGVRWRWLREKGLAYAELFNTYEGQVANALGRDGGKERLRMDGETTPPHGPGVYVPPFSWNLP